MKAFYFDRNKQKYKIHNEKREKDIMKRFKLTIMAFLGVIAVVMAFMFSGMAKVNAANSYTATYSWRMGSTKDVPTSGQIVFGKSTLKNSTSLSSNNTVDGETFSYYGQSESGSRTVTIRLTDDEWTNNDVMVYVYYYTGDSRTITIGAGSATTATKSKVAVLSGLVDKTHNTIVQSGNMGWCGIDIVLAKKVTVTALQQEAVVGATTYVRFVFIISGNTALSSADFVNKLTLILDEGEKTQQTKTCSPHAYNRITLNGETYTATVSSAEYSFDNSINTNDIYVVYVVGFTTSNYTGHNIKASLNVNLTEYKTSGYDFA